MTTRNRRAGVEDRWFTADGTPKAGHGRGKRWMARYVDDTGKERSRSFDRKTDAQRWLDAEVTTKFETGTYVTPEAGRVTRIPAGHPEGYLEGFAQIYSDVAEQIAARIEGREPDPAALLVPTVADGLRGVQFISAAVDSSRNSAAWTSLSHT